MSSREIVKKSLPALQLAARRSVVAEQPQIAEVVGPSFDAIASIIGSTPGALETPVTAYNMTEEGTEVTVGYAYSGPEQQGFELITLRQEPEAFVTVHMGPMMQIHHSWQALHEEILARGYEPSGPCRELYVRAESADQSDWVTELQQPVRRAG